VVPEAPLETTAHGLVPRGEGWFVLNARWRHAEGRGAFCDIEGDTEFAQYGVNLFVLEPGNPMAMYAVLPTRADVVSRRVVAAVAAGA
jgi:hypothetical protein